MDASMAIGLWWVVFGGSHLLLSSTTVRPRLRSALGEQPFRGVYSLVALASFIALVWTFATHKHAGPLLWTTLGPPVLARWANHALMALAFVLVVTALLPQSAAPSSLAAPGARTDARGILRITRHPLLSGLGCFGLAHLLVNGALGDVLFFGGFPCFCWIGARHQDARLSRERPAYGAFAEATSIVPFAAMVRGRQRLVVRELPPIAITAGLLLFVLVRAWHGALFGP